MTWNDIVDPFIELFWRIIAVLGLPFDYFNQGRAVAGIIALVLVIVLVLVVVRAWRFRRRTRI